MPSVMGLLEERERAARQRVEVLQAELLEAETVWERFVTVAAVRECGTPPAATYPEGWFDASGPLRHYSDPPFDRHEAGRAPRRRVHPPHSAPEAAARPISPAHSGRWRLSRIS